MPERIRTWQIFHELRHRVPRSGLLKRPAAVWVLKRNGGVVALMRRDEDGESWEAYVVDRNDDGSNRVDVRPFVTGVDFRALRDELWPADDEVALACALEVVGVALSNASEISEERAARLLELALTFERDLAARILAEEVAAAASERCAATCCGARPSRRSS